VGIGTPAPAQRLEVVGNVKVSGNGNGFIFADNTTMTSAGATLGANTFTGNQSVTGNVSATGTISATGAVSGASASFTGDVNTGTHYNIRGFRVLSSGGFGNTNTSVGAGAGSTTASGDENSFFGQAAGGANVGGSGNSFFGTHAGLSSATGSSNSFFGTDAGLSNSNENNNTFIGASSNGAAGITNATAIGSNASVTRSNSLVLGSIDTVNGATSNTNVGIGIPNPTSVLHIVSQAEQLITASTSWHGGTWVNLANTDTGVGRTWNLISTGSANSEGAGKLLVRDATGSGAVRMTFNTAGNVGIGTTGPNSRLQVSGGDAAVATQGFGMILKATDGANCFRVTVNNAGVLSQTLITCP
jgi:hypothetical protein